MESSKLLAATLRTATAHMKDRVQRVRAEASCNVIAATCYLLLTYLLRTAYYLLLTTDY